MEDTKPPSGEKKSSAETNLLTMRLPLCHENPIRRWHFTLRPHTHTHTELSPLLYRSIIIFVFIVYLTIHSSSSFSSWETLAWPPYDEFIMFVMFDHWGKTWPLTLSGRLHELLLYTDTFILFFELHPHLFLLRQAHLVLMWVQSKSKQTMGCGWMCVNLRKTS